MSKKFDLTVAICTFGHESWVDLANRRAVPSVKRQGNIPFIQIHGMSLHESRNEVLDLIDTEWVIYLDADDELDQCFISNMTLGTADLRAPSVRYVRPNGILTHPRMPRVAGHTHRCTADCLAFGNWLVVGTAVRVEMIKSVGGWRDWPCYEDWDLWVRCWQNGATVEARDDAIYMAHVRHESRNRSGSIADRNEVHKRIAKDLGLPIP